MYLMNIVDTACPPSSASAIHKATAIFTLQHLHAASPFKDAWLDPEKAQGTQIRWREFLAPYTMRVNAQNLFSNPFLSTEDIDSLCPRGEQGDHVNFRTGSSTKAFHCPPYSLQLSAKEAENLFQKINQHLFGDDMSALTVYRWSTDWADYFTDGNEWWGSHLWTVENPQTELMIGLAASATDSLRKGAHPLNERKEATSLPLIALFVNYAEETEKKKR